MTTGTAIDVSILDGWNDSRCTAESWNSLLASGGTDVPFLTFEWQRAWWESFRPGKLLLIAAHKEGRLVAVAPLFSLSGMVFFVGSGGSDYLDFIGDIGDPRLLDEILRTARDSVVDFVGFRFHHIPDSSSTSHLLDEAAIRLALPIFDEGDLPAPYMAIGQHGREALAAAEKKSLVRHQRYFEREGALQVDHWTEADEILPHLEAFFEQHIQRWAETDYPSLFLQPDQRRFYERLTRAAGGSGWLRFTRVVWNGEPIAYHYGFCYNGRFLWYKPTFDVAFARRSPGEVLLRNLLLTAAEEQVSVFDFGLGDEAFKSRFATAVETVRTWALYSPEVVANDGATP